ncbi:transcription termination/antitermination protein NusA [Ruficoccus amylovorans]|uniref:Transcription termination/antitermination protein NusA n=1 Tax=Ruficoccus amylovorans TaxID=1804625 RepID=A0A842HDD9_9BACT|nr:transcription termination factor NusA [Ruficoccus amylovorans]MBC2593607.1 transcription termination/antitermination protein NusA [Ruficoccus amylovorans]
MSNEILSVLEYMEKEKGISREDMIATIAAAIKSAAQKGVNAGAELDVQIDPRTGALKAWTLLRVVDSFSDPASEIPLDKAHVYDKNARVGDIVRKDIDPAFLGRIAAQTARQAIMQRVRQFEKERIYDDYKDSVGDIVTGVVRRRERGDLIVDLGKAEAILPPRERVPGEDYAPGERIRCLLLAIESTPRGPELVLSRSSIKFVRRLFELEVTEIADGTVTLEGMAREPGYRTKICVHSNDPKVDPVGACVGARGARVKSIVRELGGEKIDIIRYFADPQQMLEEAIKPAIPKNLHIDPIAKRIYFEVSEDDLAVAIGRRGQNAKLTSRLMGWRLDIGKERREAATLEERAERAGVNLAQSLGIDDEMAEKLVAMGINSVEVIAAGVTADDLVESGDFTPEQAAAIIAKVNQLQSQA